MVLLSVDTISQVGYVTGPSDVGSSEGAADRIAVVVLEVGAEFVDDQTGSAATAGAVVTALATDSDESFVVAGIVAGCILVRAAATAFANSGFASDE